MTWHSQGTAGCSLQTSLQIQPQLIRAACTAKVTLESSKGWSSKLWEDKQVWPGRHNDAVPGKCYLECAAANTGLMQAEGCCSFYS